MKLGAKAREGLNIMLASTVGFATLKLMEIPDKTNTRAIIDTQNEAIRKLIAEKTDCELDNAEIARDGMNVMKDDTCVDQKSKWTFDTMRACTYYPDALAPAAKKRNNCTEAREIVKVIGVAEDICNNAKKLAGSDEEKQTADAALAKLDALKNNHWVSPDVCGLRRSRDSR